jgi:hypothetical protein
LKNVEEFHLNGFRGTDLSGLKNIKKLFLSYSFPVSDISAVTTLRDVNIENCPLVTHFCGLNLTRLKITILDLGAQRTRSFPIYQSGVEIIRNLTFLEAIGVIFEERKLNRRYLSFVHLSHIQTMELFRSEFSQFPEGGSSLPAVIEN